MATVTLKGNPVQTSGELPEIGSQAPDFQLVAADMSTKTLADFKGKNLILNVFVSLDTGTCAQSVRAFNAEAAELDNTTVLCISRDLPFAHKRFCAAEGIENVITLSDFRYNSFGKDYGIEILDGPLEGLLSRCVIVLDDTGKVIYTEQVSEIPEEPNYKAPLYALLNE